VANCLSIIAALLGEFTDALDIRLATLREAETWHLTGYIAKPQLGQRAFQRIVFGDATAFALFESRVNGSPPAVSRPDSSTPTTPTSTEARHESHGMRSGRGPPVASPNVVLGRPWAWSIDMKTWPVFWFGLRGPTSGRGNVSAFWPV
jgi:hypothetical protein